MAGRSRDVEDPGHRRPAGLKARALGSPDPAQADGVAPSLEAGGVGVTLVLSCRWSQSARLTRLFAPCSVAAAPMASVYRRPHSRGRRNASRGGESAERDRPGTHLGETAPATSSRLPLLDRERPARLGWPREIPVSPGNGIVAPSAVPPVGSPLAGEPVSSRTPTRDGEKLRDRGDGVGTFRSCKRFSTKPACWDE